MDFFTSPFAPFAVLTVYVTVVSAWDFYQATK